MVASKVLFRCLVFCEISTVQLNNIDTTAMQENWPGWANALRHQVVRLDCKLETRLGAFIVGSPLEQMDILLVVQPKSLASTRRVRKSRLEVLMTPEQQS